MLSKQISTRLTRLSYLNPLSIFMAVKTEHTNGFASISLSFHAIKHSLSQALLKFTFPPFPPLFFHLGLKEAQHSPSGLAPAFADTRSQQQQNGTVSPCRIAMPGNDTNVSACPPLLTTHPTPFFPNAAKL